MKGYARVKVWSVEEYGWEFYEKKTFYLVVGSL